MPAGAQQRPRLIQDFPLALNELVAGGDMLVNSLYLWLGSGWLLARLAEQQRPVSNRYRGIHILTAREDGTPKCVACYMCATVCPAECIYIESGERPEKTIEKYPTRFDIDLLRCVYCGFCVDACPEEAIIMSRENDLVGASFGRGFYVLDDYTPLREIDEAGLQEEALLFPPRRAWWYIERRPLGGGGSRPVGRVRRSSRTVPREGRHGSRRTRSRCPARRGRPCPGRAPQATGGGRLETEHGSRDTRPRRDALRAGISWRRAARRRSPR